MVALGDTGVGKSSMLLRYTEGTFSALSYSTIGASFFSSVVRVPLRKSGRAREGAGAWMGVTRRV